MGAEEEEVAKMGCPSLGEHTQVEVVIEESYEFKVSVFVCAQTVSPLTCVHICNQEALRNESAAHQFHVRSCEILITHSLAAFKSAALNIT